MTATYSAPNTETVASGARWLFVGDIAPSPLNPRKIFEQEGLDELAASIQQDGLIEPLVVRPNPSRKSDSVLHADGPRWELIAGERRWRACQQIGIAQVLCVVREADDRTALRLALVENLQRRDLDPIEEAEGYAQLNRVVGLKQAEIASAVNRSQPAVANALRLLELPEDVQERIRRRELSVSHGIALARYKDFPALASKIAELAVEHGWTSKRLEDDPHDAYPVQNLGLVRRLYGARFDTSVCRQCPFNAYRADSSRLDDHRWGTCLKPDHAAELEAAALAEQQQAIAAAAESGESTITLADLRYEQYQRLDWMSTLPEGCSAECACRALALDGDDTPIAICTNPRRFNQLRSAPERAAKKAKRSAVQERVDEVEVAVDNLTVIGSNELALIVAPLVGQRMPKSAWETLRRHNERLPAEPYQGEHTAGETLYATLSRLDPLSLVKLGLEAQLRAELNNEAAGYGPSKRTAWWLERPKAVVPTPVSTGVQVAEMLGFVDPVRCDGHGCGAIVARADAIEGEVNGQPAWFCPECAEETEWDEPADAPQSVEVTVATDEVAITVASAELPSAAWDAVKEELTRWKSQSWTEGDEDGAE